MTRETGFRGSIPTASNRPKTDIVDLFQAVFLALIQGVTEFLPVSSSAHLVLPSILLGWPDQGLAFDTSVHLGSLLAVTVYFRRDIFKLSTATIRLVTRGQSTPESGFAINLLIASLPILPVGFLLRFQIEQHLRSVEVIIVTTIVFAIFLYLADRRHSDRSPETSLNWKQAVLIGISQCLALIPGTSRSGVTMTTALAAGFSREAASRISFLISIPTIAGAGCLKLIDLATGQEPVLWEYLAIGTLVSMASAYLCIYLFLETINRVGFLPFVLYRLLLGVVLFTITAWRFAS